MAGRARRSAWIRSTFRGRGPAGRQVSAGRHLNDRVFVEVGKGAAAGSEDVRLEVELLPNLSLNAGTNAQAQSGVGLNWRFDY